MTSPSLSLLPFLSSFSARSARAIVMGGLALATIGSSARANASEPSAATHGALLVHYEAVEGCPSAEAFHQELASRLAQGPAPAQRARFDLRIERAGAKYRGTLNASHPAQGPARTITAATCSEVASAASLMIAMAAPLGGTPEDAALFPPNEDTPLPPEPVAETPPPVVVTASSTVSPTPAPAPAKSSLQVHFSAGAGVVVRGLPDEWSSTGGLGPRLEGAVELRTAGWAGSFQLAASYLAPTGSSTFEWAGFDASICPYHVEPVPQLLFAPCLRTALTYGKVTHRYVEPGEPPTVSDWLAAVGGGGRVRWSPGDTFYLEAQISGMTEMNLSPGIWSLAQPHLVASTTVGLRF